jgi:ABC-type transport system involved in cytochrome c biogenesis permease subunit
MQLEQTLHQTGLAVYLLAALAAIGALRRRDLSWLSMLLVAAGLLVHGAGIVLRWQRLDHGPYVSLFEFLSSSVWSLHAALLLVVLIVPRWRPTLALSLPVADILVVWLMTVAAKDTLMPVTYDTIWLPFHVWLGKAFLGLVLAALGGALLILLRKTFKSSLPPFGPPDDELDSLSWKLIRYAFAFETMMLIAGAAWAQDAWGRYWAWDPLETWSFITWLAVGGSLHFRLTRQVSPVWSAALIVLIYLVAFSTLFGIPFLSTAPHKGMV